MKIERIYLDPSDDRVYVDSYLPDLLRPDMPAMLVIPGGGYSAVCTDREGEPIALEFLSLGYVAFVLNYRVGQKDDRFPMQLLDASRAILYIRKNAERYSIHPEKVFAVGFSAGGHLAGSLAVCYDDVTDLLGIQKGENRPNGVALGYPVVTLLDKTHEGSFISLLKRPFADITEEEKMKFSLDARVDASSAPMFIMHTATDQLVPPVGALRLAAACVDHHVPVNLELYPYGPHGLATADERTDVPNVPSIQPIAKGWMKRADAFFRTL